MELGQVGFVLFGAVVAALGSVAVGLFLQRRESHSRARSAARAVWFEIGINAVAIELARDHGVFTALTRSSFDRLLPDPVRRQLLSRLAEAAHAAHDRLAARAFGRDGEPGGSTAAEQPVTR